MTTDKNQLEQLLTNAKQAAQFKLASDLLENLLLIEDFGQKELKEVKAVLSSILDKEVNN